MLKTLFNFNGGVKPAYQKAASTAQAIGALPLPGELTLPLHQQVGGTPRPIIAVGEHVLKGQRIGDADGTVSAAVHAPTSGDVIAIEPRQIPHSSGLSALCVVIRPDGNDTWCEHSPFDIDRATPEQTRRYLMDMGLVGLGGAVFPTHLKLSPGKTASFHTLIINGAECEPYITCDDMLMRERAGQILAGVAFMAKLLTPTRIVVGIEDNKPEALAAMRLAAQAQADARIDIIAVPTRYPAGGAKQLIRVLTGIEVPHGARSTDYGVQCFNVGTAAAVYDAIALGRPLISRVVTVAGNIAHARNFDVLLGTPMSAVIAVTAPKPDTDRLIMGGPMMGYAMPSVDVPVVKATNCLLVGSPALFPPPPPEMPCIRCGDCASACPADLQPFDLYWFSRAKLFEKARDYHLFDCIECGCCAYVCPSHIPLVDYYRFAKSEITASDADKAAADAARERHEFRQFRDERDASEKAARLAARTATRTAAVREQSLAVAASTANEPPTPSANENPPTIAVSPALTYGESVPSAAIGVASPSKQDLIAAALARARAKAQTPPQSPAANEPPTP
jgi:Na+-translocating ferredoxin:NAD+ oxidoreductase subunit C